jgi:hypothetical protein
MKRLADQVRARDLVEMAQPRLDVLNRLPQTLQAFESQLSGQIERKRVLADGIGELVDV